MIPCLCPWWDLQPCLISNNIFTNSWVSYFYRWLISSILYWFLFISLSEVAPNLEGYSAWDLHLLRDPLNSALSSAHSPAAGDFTKRNTKMIFNCSFFKPRCAVILLSQSSSSFLALLTSIQKGFFGVKDSKRPCTTSELLQLQA